MRMDAETRTFFETLMKADVRPEQEHLKLLILDQLKTLRNKSGRCVWHTAMLSWCTDVYRSNPGAYQHMALGGFLKSFPIRTRAANARRAFRLRRVRAGS